jgi:Ca2+-binding EF-hand superfamily protein
MQGKAALSDEVMKQTVEEIFKKYDTDKSGTIEVHELAHVIKDIFTAKGGDRQVKEADVKRVMTALDTNHDGKLCKEEFLVLLKRCMG